MTSLTARTMEKVDKILAEDERRRQNSRASNRSGAKTPATAARCTMEACIKRVDAVSWLVCVVIARSGRSPSPVVTNALLSYGEQTQNE